MREPFCQVLRECLNDIDFQCKTRVFDLRRKTFRNAKQLRCAIRSAGFYFPECIADSDGQFAKGAGSVIAIVGTGGRGFSSVGLTTDADRQYFATAMGSNTPGFGWGYLRVTITAKELFKKCKSIGIHRERVVR